MEGLYRYRTCYNMDYRKLLEDDVDRDGGFLTPHDRRFLLDRTETDVREDMSSNAERQKRYRIRQKTKDAVYDLQYLMYADADLDQILDATDQRDVDAANAATTAFYMLLANTVGREQLVRKLLDTFLNDTRIKYAMQHGVYPEIEASVTVDVPDPEDCEPLEEYRDRLEAGEEVPEGAEMVLEYLGRHPEQSTE